MIAFFNLNADAVPSEAMQAETLQLNGASSVGSMPHDYDILALKEKGVEVESKTYDSIHLGDPAPQYDRVDAPLDDVANSDSVENEVARAKQNQYDRVSAPLDWILPFWNFEIYFSWFFERARIRHKKKKYFASQPLKTNDDSRLCLRAVRLSHLNTHALTYHLASPYTSAALSANTSKRQKTKHKPKKQMSDPQQEGAPNTVPEATPTKGPSSGLTPAGIGATAGVAAAVVLIALLLFVLWKRKQDSDREKVRLDRTKSETDLSSLVKRYVCACAERAALRHA